MKRVLIVIDFDGVINTATSKHTLGETFFRDTRAFVDGFELYMSRAMIRELNKIKQPVYWLSTWGNELNSICKEHNIFPNQSFQLLTQDENINDKDKCNIITKLAKNNRDKTIIWIDDSAPKFFTPENNVVCVIPDERIGISVNQVNYIRETIESL